MSSCYFACAGTGTQDTGRDIAQWKLEKGEYSLVRRGGHFCADQRFGDVIRRKRTCAHAHLTFSEYEDRCHTDTCQVFYPREDGVAIDAWHLAPPGVAPPPNEFRLHLGDSTVGQRGVCDPAGQGGPQPRGPTTPDATPATPATDAEGDGGGGGGGGAFFLLILVCGGVAAGTLVCKRALAGGGLRTAPPLTSLESAQGPLASPPLQSGTAYELRGSAA